MPEPLKFDLQFKCELEEETKIALDEWERGCYETISDLLLTHQEYIVERIKQRIKQACEFFLRYKDNPELLWREQLNFREELDKFIENFDEDFSDIAEFLSWSSKEIKEQFLISYNEWLFKLAFKDVFENDQEVMVDEERECLEDT